MSRFSRKAESKLVKMKRRASRHQQDKEEREYETHYFYDARQTMPSISRSHSKTERGARNAAIAKIDQERYNKAVVVHLPTMTIVVDFRRDPDSGDIRVADARYQRLLGEKPTHVNLNSPKLRLVA